MLFADARGSMVDIVQMVGRALRTRPGRGKLATLIVPVFLGPGESGDEMVTSDAYKTLSKVLGALRAHDTDTIEALADPRVRSGREDIDDQDQEHDGEDADDGDILEDGNGAAALSRAAAGVLRFSEERDPAVLAQFVRLRVIDPEGAYWRRGIEAAGRWLRETGNTVLRVPYTAVTPEDWGGVGGYPLGQWIADQRRTYAAGTLEAGRVAELEKLGMVWSEQDAAWADGIAVAKEYAAAHGHFLPPTTAVWDGHPIGVWAKTPARQPGRRGRTRSCARPASPFRRRPERCPRRGGTSWTRSIRGGARSGTPRGSAATASPRTTSRPAEPSRRPWAASSSTAKTSDAGSPRSGSDGNSSCPHSSGSWRTPSKSHRPRRRRRRRRSDR